MDSTNPNAIVELDHPRRVLGSPIFNVYLLTILFGILTLAILDTLLNRYYGVDARSSTLISSDGPVDIFQPGCRAPIIGLHYFGDFQSEYCRMRGSTPYPSNNPSLYLPGFYVLLSMIASFVSVATSWKVATILAVMFLVAVVKTHLKGARPIIAPMILLAVFNPFWQTIDRGNISWLLGVGLIILGAKSELRTERTWLFAVAVTLKIQLAPFLLILLCGGKVIDKWRSLMQFAALFMLLNFVIPLLGWRDFGQFYPNYFKSLRSAKLLDNVFDYGIRSLTRTVTQLNLPMLFWIFFLLFSIGLTIYLVFINALDPFLDRRNEKEELLLACLCASSMIVLFSPLSYLYGLMVLLVPTVLIFGMESEARLIHKVQLALITICTLPNNVSLDSFINQRMHSPDVQMISFPSLGNLIPSVILPSITLSAIVIGFIELRRQKIVQRIARRKF
jgi:hypothetical protein